MTNVKEHTGTATCLCDHCQSRQEFLWDLKKLMQAAQRLDHYWDNKTAVLGNTFYPFQEPFHEVVLRIQDWRLAVQAAADREEKE